MGLMTFNSKATRIFPADAKLLYEILTDYDTYAEWMPLVGQSKLLAKETDLAIAELDLTAPKGEKVSLECIHSRDKMVLSRVIRGPAAGSQLQWTLTPAGNEQSSVTLTIEGRRNWRWLLGGRYFMGSAKSCLAGLESHLSMFRPEVSIEGQGEQILDISETGEGLVCRFRGKKYMLTPANEGSDG
ncbi:MAG TPA: SRPBCC family protein [Bryobacteraceae bacterium]|nr:SRPBCC family protein [Bryobacteraceae bacterium]